MNASLAEYRRLAGMAVAETLWPTRCALCDEPGTLLCDACARALTYIDACLACPRCGAPFGRVQCTECNRVMLAASGRDELPLSSMASAVVLDARTRAIVLTYKDRGEQRLSTVIADTMARYVPPLWTNARGAASATTVTFVPATKTARRRRGFDHAERLANDVANTLNLPCARLLDRPHTADQRALSRTQRFANTKDRFTVCSGTSPPERVIVVDDVCTTGATLYAAADALSANGVQAIYALTFARA